MRGVQHTPTKETREKAVLLLSAGIPSARVAKTLGICDNVFRKHYSVEIETALDEKIHEAVGVLFKAIRNGNLNATIFFLKTRAGWSTEDNKSVEQNEEIKKQIVALREELDKKNRKDY